MKVNIKVIGYKILYLKIVCRFFVVFDIMKKKFCEWIWVVKK